MKRSLALIALLSAAPMTAGADADTHYQDTLIGERASGMGGAFTALADEATGAYYNPAGIISRGSLLIQLSMSAYKLRKKRLKVLDLCGSILDDDHSSLFGFPAALGFARSFGPPDLRQAIGLLVVVPHVDRSGQGVVSRGRCGANDLDVGVASALSDRVILGALSYAIEPTANLKIGATVGLTVRDLSSTILVSVLGRGPGLDGTTTAVNFANVDADMWSVYGRLGAILSPTENLRLGLTVTSPNLPIASSGSLDFATSSGVPSDLAGTRLRVLEDLEFRWRTPPAIAAGAALVWPGQGTLSLDVRLHLAVDRYALVRREQTTLNRVPTVAREMVFNASAGGELWLSDRWIVRGGLFTNRSSFPTPDPELAANHDRTDLYGMTLGVSFAADESSLLSASLQGQLGSGEVLTFRAESDPSGVLQTSSSLGQAEELSILVSYGGSFDIR